MDRVIQLMELPHDVVELSHLGSETQTELEYRLAWARTRLKNAGLIRNSRRGVWALTAKGRQTDPVNAAEVVKAADASGSVEPTPDPIHSADLLAVEEGDTWKEPVLTRLKQMPPDGFERLCQRVLREAGFVEVEVTGRSGDGGIDGRGVVRLRDVLTFPVVCQCKRYDGAVGSQKVRDFRGAMSGRADRGLILTTGRYTRDAEDEATRDGVDPIDLIDGYELVDLLREFEIGLTPVPAYRFDEEFFESI